MTDDTTLKPYAVEVTVDAGRDEVWGALTQPLMLRRWFGWDYDGLDAEIRQIFVDEASLLAPERMGWADGSYLEVDGDDLPTVVRAVRDGKPRSDPDEYDAIEEGWRSFLVQLRFLVERRPAGERRTLYLTGETTGRQVMDLVDGDWTTVGSRVAWVVDAAGRLVVVAGRVPLPRAEAAGMQVVVSTYGLSDSEFEVARDEWTKGWAAIAEGVNVTYAGMPSP